MKVDKAVNEVYEEYKKRLEEGKRFETRNDGLVELLKEVSGLWESIRYHQTSDEIKAGGVKIGATALLFLVECFDE